MELILANPRGFCAGVDRAIEIVERALEVYGAPIYVRHEVVHNTFVVNDLKQKGAIFVDELSEVPDDATVIFSAHGVSSAVQQEAENRKLKVFDATCPLVTKVHLEVVRHGRQGCDVILIGHAGHPEVEGTMGRYKSESPEADIYLVESVEDVAAVEINNPENVSFVTQTTLSMDDTQAVIAALKARFPAIQGPRKDDICYATQNRQDAVKSLASKSDIVLVVGSATSSNSNRLREIAEKMSVPAYLIDGVEDIQLDWFKDKQVIGLTAGASAPEILVNQVRVHLQDIGVHQVIEDQGKPENVTFSLPKALQ
jgi:4-hydroxy-3-methylbut-2-enyl diphosphate reductase